jgi:hypothetical protein
MKILQTLMALVLVLGTLAIPSFAQETPEDMSPELKEIVYGRDGFSNYNAKAVEAQIAGTSLVRPEGMPLTVWRTIYGRDGFDFYASATERPVALVNGMPAELWDAIASRDGFAVYGAGDSAGASSELLAATPGAMPADLWQIITGRDGFDAFSSSGTCAVC